MSAAVAFVVAAVFVVVVVVVVSHRRAKTARVARAVCGERLLSRPKQNIALRVPLHLFRFWFLCKVQWDESGCYMYMYVFIYYGEKF